MANQYSNFATTVDKTEWGCILRCISAWKMALLYSGILAILVLETPSAQAQLAAPSNLEATALKNGKIQLVWDDNFQGETGFAIIADTDSSFTNQPRTRRIGGPETTTFTTPRLQGATTYWIKVRALGPSGNSDWSEASAATTPPDELQAVVVSSNQIDLSWTPNPQNNDITSYTVRYSPDIDFDNATKYLNNSAENCHVTELLPNIKYYFEIKAEGDSDEIDSPYSESVHATTWALPLSVGPEISDVFFGLNAWMPDQAGTDTRGGGI
ncbi:MAG: fibronectin type III domain-containing protein [Planctomycetes bacterium]|nr:fibronectin type III domain-containing protein [Planctomycetota bacterium]